MTPKFAKDEANRVLYRLDRIASTIKASHQAWGMPFEDAKAIVNALDATADEIEVASFGAESLAARQVEVIKEASMGRTAEVVHRETDEGYMKTFENPMAPVQTEADEPYMKAYGPPDQSSVMLHGQSTTGRPLTPHRGDTPSPV
jgi:hypothetical protein